MPSLQNSSTTTVSVSAPVMNSSSSKMGPNEAKALKTEYKNLIKEKVLLPSRLPEFDIIRGHHQHLVIRDSHYLIKAPTSFITCSSCHRGRVLRVQTIKENLTNDILIEIYQAISKGECSKRKPAKDTEDGEAKESTTPVKRSRAKKPNKEETDNGTELEDSPNKRKLDLKNEMNESIAGESATPVKTPVKTPSKRAKSTTTVRKSKAKNTITDPIGGNPCTASSESEILDKESSISVFAPFSTQQQLSSTLDSLDTSPPLKEDCQQNSYNNTTTHIPKSNIPKFEDFFSDWEEITELPPLDERLPVKSLSTTIKVTNYTLTSLFSQCSQFPTTLDFFLSLSIEKDYGDSFFNKDTLLIPFPTYSCTSFMKDLNKDLFLKDDHIRAVIMNRVKMFVNQPLFNVQNFKVVILFNFFQEGVPQRPQEHQAHKYVGNVYTLSGFSVNVADNSLTYQSSRITFNHNYTMIDQKEEWIKSEVFNQLVVNPLQKEVYLKFGEYLLGSYIDISVLERGPMMTFLPYTVESGYIVTSSSSMLVVNFINLKILRVLMSENGLQMISYLVSIKVNSKYNLYVLKLLLDLLHSNESKGGNSIMMQDSKQISSHSIKQDIVSPVQQMYKAPIASNLQVQQQFNLHQQQQQMNSLGFHQQQQQLQQQMMNALHSQQYNSDVNNTLQQRNFPPWS